MARQNVTTSPCSPVGANGANLSVVIVNWNTRELLLQCLRSIAMQDLSVAQRETIVVDNGSTDGSVAAVRTEFPDVMIVENREPLGFSVAANQGLRQSRGARILLTQPDVTFTDPQAIQMLMDGLERWTSAGVVTPRFVYPDGSFQRMYNDFPTLSAMCLATSPAARFDVVRRLRPVARYRLEGMDFERVAEIPQPGMSCALIARGALERVGLLDEQFTIYFSDVDWCLRARDCGVKMVYLPDVLAVHLRGASTRMMGDNQWQHSVGSLVRYFRKHKGIVQTRILQIALAVSLFVEKAILFVGERRRGRRVGPRYRAAEILAAVLGRLPSPGGP